MSHYAMVIWLFVPIILVVIVLMYAARKRKNLLQDKIATYLSKVTGETGIINSFQKNLIYQMIVVDEEEGRVLVIDHKDELNHHIFPFEDIDEVNVYYVNEVLPSNGNQKSENVVKQIGVQLSMERMKDDKHLVLFDHTEHSIYLRDDFEKQAWQLCDKLLQFQKNMNKRRVS